MLTPAWDPEGAAGNGPISGAVEVGDKITHSAKLRAENRMCLNFTTMFSRFDVVYFSKAKTRFQSSFMFTTVQPYLGATSMAVVSLPLLFGLAS